MSKKNKGLNFDNSYYYGFNSEIFPQDVSRKRGIKIASVVILIIAANIAVFVMYLQKDMKTIKAEVEPVSSYVQATAEPASIKDEEVPLATAAAKATVVPTATPKPEIISSLKSYYKENKDLIGWLTINNTPIDNPVMFTPDNETYYLDKDFYGDAFKAGTLFIDDESKVGEPNSNIIIYGHNMKNQTMFGSLKKFAEKSYFNEHKKITFNTLYEEATYEVYAAFYAKVLTVSDTSFKYYRATNFANKSEYSTFIYNIDKMKLYDTGVSSEYGDQFITLSTCSYHTENGRFVVVARKVKK